MNYKNPFITYRNWSGDEIQAVDVTSRLDMVKRFGADELHSVLRMPGVQKTVRDAARRRLKKLTGEEVP